MEPTAPLPARDPVAADPLAADPLADSLLTDYDAPPRQRYGLHLGLFLLTFVSMVYAGGVLAGRDLLYGITPVDGPLGPFLTSLSVLADPVFLGDGLRYAFAFLLFLTVHEFGHFIAARRHRIDVSLPYFIPIPLIGLPVLNFGTFGAVIRIREPLRRTRQLFDVGAAGPLAGFVVALGLLVVAVLTLPGADYLLSVPGHEATAAYVAQTGRFPAPEQTLRPGELTLLFGDTPLFWLVRQVVPGLPSGSELMHYPVLLAAWLGLFFTALNLLPVGQLDGGHVVYALFGARTHQTVARVATFLLVVSGALGFAEAFGADAFALTGVEWAVWPFLAVVLAVLLWRVLWRDPALVIPAVVALTALAAVAHYVVPGLVDAVGYWGWLIWVGLIAFVIRVDHPPVLVHEPLTPGQRALGYLCIALFVLCFSIRPIYLAVGL